MRTNILLVILCLSSSLWGQDPWKIIATDIRPDHYYGVTVGNGMLGIVSSAYPFRTDNVVLAGSYDKYGRGRVSNFLNGFNMLNTSVSIDGKTVNNVIYFIVQIFSKYGRYITPKLFDSRRKLCYSSPYS